MSVKILGNKTSCWLLAVMLVLQSCSIYQKTPVSLNEAAAAQTRVLVTRTNEQKVRFKRIEQIDGSYFGRKNVKGENVKIPLTESDIKSVRVLDKSKTALANVGICVVSLLVVAVVILAISYSSASDSGGFDIPSKL